MFHFARTLIDTPLYHRSVITISQPYTGPLFLWSQLPNGKWTWDLKFDFIIQPPRIPDVCVAWGIHQDHPHNPPENIANWCPRVGFSFFAGLPIARSVGHGNHHDWIQLRVDPLGRNDAQGNPMHEIKITFVHTEAGEEEPCFEYEYPWWWPWWWFFTRRICWWRAPKFFVSNAPEFGPNKKELAALVGKAKKRSSKNDN